MLLTAIVTFVIGVLAGSTGMGGFLLPPLLLTFFGLEVREAVAHALTTFVIAGALATYLYHRKHGLQWKWGLVLILGALPGAWVGNTVSTALSEVALRVIISICLMGVSAFLILERVRRSAGVTVPESSSSRRPSGRGTRLIVVILLGVLSGAAGVLTGIGGPLFTVPVLIGLGLEPLVAVGTGLFSGIAVSTAGLVVLPRTPYRVSPEK